MFCLHYSCLCLGYTINIQCFYIFQMMSIFSSSTLTESINASTKVILSLRSIEWLLRFPPPGPQLGIQKSRKECRLTGRKEQPSQFTSSSESYHSLLTKAILSIDQCRLPGVRVQPVNAPLPIGGIVVDSRIRDGKLRHADLVGVPLLGNQGLHLPCV